MLRLRVDILDSAYRVEDQLQVFIGSTKAWSKENKEFDHHEVRKKFIRHADEAVRAEIRTRRLQDGDVLSDGESDLEDDDASGRSRSDKLAGHKAAEELNEKPEEED